MLPTFDLIDVVKLSYIKMDKGHKYVSAIHSEDCLRSINICFYDGLTSLLFFVCTLIFEKRELKIINCFNRMCTLTDISIIAEWIFFKVTKDLLCLHNSDGSGKFGQ